MIRQLHQLGPFSQGFIHNGKTESARQYATNQWQQQQFLSVKSQQVNEGRIGRDAASNIRRTLSMHASRDYGQTMHANVKVI
jgi:hypothetical protein